MQARCRLFTLLFSSVMILVFSTVAIGADPKAEPVLVNAKNFQWAAAPPALPKGAKVAVLYGDPSSNGPYVLLLSMPSKYKLPFHWHSQAQYMTVISGTLYVASTETYDKKIAHAVKAGGFVYVPPQGQQFAFTKGKTVVEVQGVGPYDIKYTNPKDDPLNGTHGEAYYFPKEYEKNELNAPAGGEPIPTF
ncbi:MAG: cupin domain-containing protein [Burkholderiales bacterium]